MRVNIDGIAIELRDLTALEWIDLDFTYLDDAGGMHFLDPAQDYIEMLGRRVAFGVAKWGDQDGITAIEITQDRSLHNTAIALSEFMDNQLPELPELEAKKVGADIQVSGDDFSAVIKSLTIAELRALNAKFNDLPPSQRKAAIIAAIVLDWDGHGAVTASDLLDDRAKSHVYILAVEVALKPFFQPPKVTVDEPASTTYNGDRDERRDDESTVVLVA